MGMINDLLLDWFGITIERHAKPDGARHATNTKTISAIFEGDALRQQSASAFFRKGLALPRETYGRDNFQTYLRDGGARSPRR
jgi:hypothetical protein